MTTSLERVEQQGATVTPMELIQRASASGASIEQMAQLFELKLRVDADEAKRAFNLAMAAFKRNPPYISKNKDVQAGPVKYSHATLDHVVEKITPALSAVGVRHRWDVRQDAALIAVTCVLSHELGHSESTVLAEMPDKSGSKNAVQAVASTVTYLQRYTLLLATGMATGGMDTDGVQPQSPAGKRMDERTLFEHIEAIESSPTMADLEKNYLISLREVDVIGDVEAKGKIVAAKKRIKAQLSKEGA